MSSAEKDAQSFSKAYNEQDAIKTGHADSWPPAAPGEWSWPGQPSASRLG